MQVIVKGANYSNCGLGVIVMQDLRAELVAQYGENAVTDERMKAIQLFMSRIGWGTENSVYSKLSFLCLPFMCDGVASMSAFYDLVHKNKVKVGYSPYVDDSNVSTYWTFDQYGCYPKHFTDTSVSACALGFGLGLKAWNSSEFAVFRRTTTPLTPDEIISNAAGFIRYNSTYGVIQTTRITSSSSYISQTLSTEQPGLTYDNFSVLVNTGTGDYATEKVFTNKGESFYTSETGVVNKSYVLDGITFGGNYSLQNRKCYEIVTFSVMGHAVGLDANEARILRDALVELKVNLNL